ncbi:putative sec-independent protein translocase protein TatB [Octadecabacter arcticus 238]|jgi:sec-independent protein translocase protein TatB|uniref:Putative sec-independent protein translocase protein TatB n=1 Tax=Octadecabacter arcticus 238 TaxID=391616 RepID=M9RR00_9RHOB|nr:Sec-independent protein translocase protein TatB [Octadecabacter arcticus]AGI72861.1 putative sec-independent protein translocase protein TatB [Octadecabacter arcticus 238]
MPNLSWMEMLVVGIVALIVIGPKDLPGMFRQVGQFVGKAKGMAREFSSAMNAAADESGINEINKTIKAAANPKKFGVDKIREASQGAVKSTLKAGGETEALKTKLSAERTATAEKLNKAMAKAAEDRIAAEKADAKVEAGPETAPKAAPKKAAPKAAAAKKAPPKTTAAKKAAPKKAATKAPVKAPVKAKSPAKDAK